MLSFVFRKTCKTFSKLRAKLAGDPNMGVRVGNMLKIFLSIVSLNNYKMIRYAQEFPGIAENPDKYFFNFWNSVVLHRHIGKRQIAVNTTGKGNQFTKYTKKKDRKKKKISDSLSLL